MRRLGVITKKRSNDILMSVSIVSPNATRDSVFLSNYASSTVVEELKRQKRPPGKSGSPIPATEGTTGTMG